MSLLFSRTFGVFTYISPIHQGWLLKTSKYVQLEQTWRQFDVFETQIIPLAETKETKKQKYERNQFPEPH